MEVEEQRRLLERVEDDRRRRVEIELQRQKIREAEIYERALEKEEHRSVCYHYFKEVVVKILVV